MANSLRKSTGLLLQSLLPGCARLEQQYPPKKIPDTHKSIALKLSAYPRISVVVPSFNQGRYLNATLESLVQQGYPELEIIVVDGGSEDNSLEVIKSYAASIKWWVSEADTGQANAINKGMVHATGEILAWLNSDDCLMPGALFKVAEHFNASENTDVVYGHRVIINEVGQDIGKWVMPGHRNFILTYVDFLPQETMFWRKTIWVKVGSHIDETFHFAMDWDLIRRFLKAGAKFRLLPIFLGQFRLHDLQKTQIALVDDGYREMELIRQKFHQSVTSGPVKSKIYFYRQRWSIYSFLLRARITELLWNASLKKIG